MKPFPAPKRGPTRRWALLVLRLWARRGWPVLIGAPAEQVQVARGILRLT